MSTILLLLIFNPIVVNNLWLHQIVLEYIRRILIHFEHRTYLLKNRYSSIVIILYYYCLSLGKPDKSQFTNALAIYRRF